MIYLKLKDKRNEKKILDKYKIINQIEFKVKAQEEISLAKKKENHEQRIES